MLCPEGGPQSVFLDHISAETGFFAPLDVFAISLWGEFLYLTLSIDVGTSFDSPPQRRPSNLSPIDPAAIAPPGQLRDLYLESDGRSAPFDEHTHPASPPPTAYSPPDRNIRTVQLTDPQDWMGGEWPDEIQLWNIIYV